MLCDNKLIASAEMYLMLDSKNDIKQNKVA